jgi:hypothetical protein
VGDGYLDHDSSTVRDYATGEPRREADASECVWAMGKCRVGGAPGGDGGALETPRDLPETAASDGSVVDDDDDAADDDDDDAVGSNDEEDEAEYRAVYGGGDPREEAVEGVVDSLYASTISDAIGACSRPGSPDDGSGSGSGSDE